MCRQGPIRYASKRILTHQEYLLQRVSDAISFQVSSFKRALKFTARAFVLMAGDMGKDKPLADLSWVHCSNTAPPKQKFKMLFL